MPIAVAGGKRHSELNEFAKKVVDERKKKADCEIEAYSSKEP